MSIIRGKIRSKIDVVPRVHVFGKPIFSQCEKTGEWFDPKTGLPVETKSWEEFMAELAECKHCEQCQKSEDGGCKLESLEKNAKLESKNQTMVVEVSEILSLIDDYRKLLGAVKSCAGFEPFTKGGHEPRICSETLDKLKMTLTKKTPKKMV